MNSGCWKGTIYQTILRFNPFPKLQILHSSKLKVFADDNLKFNKYGGKFSKRVENTLGKGEMLVLSNFSFSHSVFKGLVLETCKNQGLFGKGLTDRHCILL